MQTLQDLKGEVEGTRDISSIVRAMKALAAVRIRQSQEAVESLTNYADTVEKGFQILMRRRPRGFGSLRHGGRSSDSEPSPTEPTLSVVMGSDLGMVGAFNRKLVDHLVEEQDGDPGRGATIALGHRVAAEMERSGREVNIRFSVPDTVEGMPDRIRDLLVRLEGFQEGESPTRIVVFYQHYRSGSEFEPRMEQLLPLDSVWLHQLAQRPWSTRRLPAFRVPPEVLLSSLVREHLFHSLFRAMAESHASENASRLKAMEAAEKRIEERLEALQGRLKQRRKQKMTEELLDIMAGVAALEKA